MLLYVLLYMLGWRRGTQGWGGKKFILETNYMPYATPIFSLLLNLVDNNHFLDIIVCLYRIYVMTKEEYLKQVQANLIQRKPANAQNMAISNALKSKDYDKLREYTARMTGRQILKNELEDEINKNISTDASKKPGGLYPADMLLYIDSQGKLNDLVPKPFEGESIVSPSGQAVGGYAAVGSNEVNFPRKNPSVYEHEASHILDNRVFPGFVSDPSTNDMTVLSRALDEQYGIDALRKNMDKHFKGAQLFELDMLKSQLGLGPKYNPNNVIDRTPEVIHHPNPVFGPVIDPVTNRMSPGMPIIEKVRKNPAFQYRPHGE